MEKTHNSKKQKCEICGKQPAYYSKLGKKVLCKEHLFGVIMKYLISAGTIGLIIFYFI